MKRKKANIVPKQRQAPCILLVYVSALQYLLYVIIVHLHIGVY
jgi:hypothetical protein